MAKRADKAHRNQSKCFFLLLWALLYATNCTTETQKMNTQKYTKTSSNSTGVFIASSPHKFGISPFVAAWGHRQYTQWFSYRLSFCKLFHIYMPVLHSCLYITLLEGNYLNLVTKFDFQCNSIHIPTKQTILPH